jgi:hypothetical protein
MIDSLRYSRDRGCVLLMNGRFECLGAVHLGGYAVQMTPHPEVNGDAYGKNCCGAHYQNDKQNLDHHRDSGYQIEEPRL